MMPQPPDCAEVIFLPPADLIPPDETGLPPGFTAERVRRLFRSRPILPTPPGSEVVAAPPAPTPPAKSD